MVQRIIGSRVACPVVLTFAPILTTAREGADRRYGWRTFAAFGFRGIRARRHRSGCGSPTAAAMSTTIHPASAGNAERASGDDRRKQVLLELIERHLPDILGVEWKNATLSRISISEPLMPMHGRHHRAVQVDYDTATGPKGCKIWLKFRAGLEQSFEVHRRIYGAAGFDSHFLPQPYFCHRLEGGPETVVAMEHVTGMRLRTAVATAALGRGRATLVQSFRRLGGQLRSFHDALALPTTRPLADSMDRLRQAIEGTQFFTAAERATLREHSERAADIVGRDRQLRMTETHGDLAVRNVIRRPDGTLTLIDCDSLQRRLDSGWCDVAHLLINIESLIRYSPLIRSRLLGQLGRGVCAGYRGESYPDGLTQDQVNALLYLLRIERALGLQGRRPLFAKLSNLSGRRYLRRFKADLVRGAHGTLGLGEMGTE